MIKVKVLSPERNRHILILTVLYFSLVIVLITELLSFLNSFNYLYLSIFWSIYTLIGIFILIKNRQKLTINEVSLASHYYQYLKNTSKFNNLVLTVIIIFLVGIFIQGLVYPPNSWDSMTYHMARVSHWISNSSINHYPTHIDRQLHQPPLAEIFISQTVILTKSDFFANSIQFFFLIFSLTTISLITQQLGLSRKMQLVTILFGLLTPEIILQGSSTQNDVVVSFFILSSIYFTLKVLQKRKLSYLIMIGISLGLALLTKGTAYIYIIPLLLLLTIYYIYTIIKERKYLIVFHGLLVIAIVSLINTGHYYRNYSLSGNTMGITEKIKDDYKNEDITFSAASSNIIRNSALHFGPYPLSIITERVVTKIHSFFDLDVNDSRYTYLKNKFCVPLSPSHEDIAPNLLQMILFIVAIGLGFIYFIRKYGDSNKILLSLYFIIIIQFILFSSYLKWQPWNTRLHTPLFFLISPIVIFIFNRFYKRAIPIILIMCSLYGINVLLFNYSRPFITIYPITHKISVFDSREKKYFSNKLSLYEDYSKIKSLILERNYNNIGIILGGDSWEYPLINNFEKDPPYVINHIGINKDNPSHSLITHTKNIEIIISDRKRRSINYKGESFIRLPESNYLFLYQKEDKPNID